MAAAIPDALRPRLGQFIRLLASDQPGEVVAAASALKRTLAGCGADLNDLGDVVERPAVILQTPRQHRSPHAGTRPRPGDVELDFSRRAAVAAALRRGLASGCMSKWESEFATSIVARLQAGRGRMTKRQGETLARLLGKIGERSAWV